MRGRKSVGAEEQRPGQADEDFRVPTRPIPHAREGYRTELEGSLDRLQAPAFLKDEPEAKPPSKREKAATLILVLGLLLSVVGLALIAEGAGPWLLYVGIALIAIPVVPHVLMMWFGGGNPTWPRE